METVQPKRTPWKSWRDFTTWAQDFSLRRKLLGGFLAVVVLVGLVTSLAGTRLTRRTIMNRARADLSRDLTAASFVLDNFRENLDRKIRLAAGTERIRTLLAEGNLEKLRNRLVMMSVENNMDFLSIADTKGQVLLRAFVPEIKDGRLESDKLVAGAAKGEGTSGIILLSVKRLTAENPKVAQLVAAKDAGDALVIEAAYPIVHAEEIIGVLYGGVTLVNDVQIVDRISRVVFGTAAKEGKETGFVAVYQGDKAVSTTLRGAQGLPAAGFKVSPEIRNTVLARGMFHTGGETRLGKAYLSAAEPIRDPWGNIVGAVQIAALEAPIDATIDRLVNAFLMVALLGVILMAAISYFLVQWINRPLELMLNSARRAAEGDLSHEVPVIARDEVGELAATFNLMIRNLAESRERLEEWGRELSSKIAVQTGALDQARKEVARVRKLASLEKMADGMAHIMAHISDPMVSPVHGEESGATSRILVMDPEEKVLDMCARILDSEGFEVETSGTAADGFRHLQEEFFDVVIADIDMPDLGGKELLKEIKYRQPDLLVILTAPFRATKEAEEAVELGAFDYIPKPFGPHQVLLTVYTALQARRTVDQTRREHASQRAEKIFQRLPVAIALADRAHRVVYNNQAFVDLASPDGEEGVRGKTFTELFGIDPLEVDKTPDAKPGARRLELEKVGRTAKLYNFKLPEEDLRVLMLLDVTDTVKKDRQADALRAETITRAQQVIHQQMIVAQEIAGLLGETTAETKAALYELMNLAKEEGES
jgi:CheY-like chemotaxis protein/HAMP domain-containing protein